MTPAALDTPVGADVDPAAVEILRVWVIERRLSASLRSELLAEPSELAILLADVFSHVCRLHVLTTGGREADTRAEMLLALSRRLVGGGIAPEDGLQAPVPAPQA